MPKIKTKRNPDLGKSRFELRFDTDLYQQIQKIADEAQISVNQFMQGIARWAVSKAHVGEGKYVGEHPVYDIETTDQPGCIWFGHELKTIGSLDENDEPDTNELSGEIYFQIDYTERHVVRDDLPVHTKQSKARGKR